MGRNYQTVLREYVRDMCDATAAHHVAEVVNMLKDALVKGGHEGLVDCLNSCLRSEPVIKHTEDELSKRMRIDFCDALEDCLFSELRPLKSAKRRLSINDPNWRYSATGSESFDNFLIDQGRLASEEKLADNERRRKEEEAAKEKRKADRAAGAAANRAEREAKRIKREAAAKKKGLSPKP